ELRERLAVPPPRRVWVAVRLDLRAGADATRDRDGDETAVPATLSAGLIRIGEAVAGHGLTYQVLDGPGLRRALASAYWPGPDDGVPARGRSAPRETWRRWLGQRAVHICYGVARWPSH